jgi:hypothetical protein
MSGTDKTIRISADASGVVEDLSRVRKEAVEANKENENAGRRNAAFNKDDIKDVEAKLNLIRELNKEDDEAGKNRIRNKQEEIRLAEAELRVWRLRKDEEGANLSGKNKTDFVNEKREQENVKRQILSEDKVDLLTEHQEFRVLTDSNKQQEEELKDIHDALKQGQAGGGIGGVGLAGGVGMMNNMTSGNVGGFAGDAAMMAGKALGTTTAAVAGAVAAGVMLSRSFESGLTSYMVASQESKSQSRKTALGASHALGMGLSSNDFLQAQSGYMRAYGGKIGENPLALTGVGVSKGISDEQIQSVLRISRYAGGSGLETVSVFENYLKGSGKSLIQLPEILSSYLKVANSILQNTGRVNKEGIQQIMASVGKSYGLEGMQLERMTSNVTAMAGKSSNPIVTSMQLETLRKLYPNMDTWEMSKIIADPSTDPSGKYLPELMNKFKNVGGKGSIYNKFALEAIGQSNSANVSKWDVDMMTEKVFDMTKKPEKMTKAQLDEYGKEKIKEAQDVTFGIKELESFFKSLAHDIGLGISSLAGVATSSSDTATNTDKMAKAIEDNNRRMQKNRSRD